MALKSNVELLAPAGDFDSLRAAVENGADAVYLGGKLFNARQLAGNFDLQLLKDALDYAHLRGVNIYLTMNTLISDAELDEAADFAKEAWLLGVDGVIVQDIGFAGALHRLIPGLPLHASTQMTVHNLEAVRMLEALGFKRVVLARELSLAEIKEIAAGTSLEIEVFIHGALCISYSGQCLMSSIIGGRSGNRGKCAQPCRLPYRLMSDSGDVEGEKGNAERYLLSPKDLCTLGELDKIAASGVRSLKIEGRMKSPEYVATVVRIYRKHLDRLFEKDLANSKSVGTSPEIGMSPKKERTFLDFEDDMHEMEQVFNRGGFTSGYFSGKPGRELMCYEKPKNWGTYLGEVLAYDHAAGIIRIKLDARLSVGDGIEVWNNENESPGTIITYIRAGGKNLREATGNSVVEAGNIRGKIFKGCKVYKTSDKKLMTYARESFEGKCGRTVELRAEASLKKDCPLILKLRDDKGNEVTAESFVIPEPAINRPLTKDRLSEQLGKTGATVFKFSELAIELDEGLSLPVSEINDVRRRAIEKLESKRLQRHLTGRNRAVLEKAISEAEGGIKGIGAKAAERRYGAASSRGEPGITLFFYKCDLNEELLSSGADRIYLPFKMLLSQDGLDFIKACSDKGIEVFIWLPVILRGNYLRLFKEKLPELSKLGIGGVLTGNIGAARLIQGTEGIKLMGDYSLNAINSISVQEYLSIGFKGITLSPELTLAGMCRIAEVSSGPIESIVYGRLPLMNSEYCPLGCVKGGITSKSACKGSCKSAGYYLRDRLGIDFPIVSDNIDCRSMILNSNVLFAPEAVKKLSEAGTGFLRLNIWDEGPEMIKELIGLHRELASGGNTMAYDGLIGRIKGGGFTKGHFFRGV